MTIDEAIKILSWENSQFPMGVNPELTKAYELGIEALKHYKYHRDLNIISFVKQLPGETKD